MSRSIWLVIVIVLAISVALMVQAQQAPAPEATGDAVAQTVKPDSAATADVFIASYFHGNVRCATCFKLETYSAEAMQTGFAKELKDSSLVWRLVNWDQDENKHFVDDYKLFTKAVILSRVRDGKEIAWANLDSIWTLVGDKERFIKYVQDQTCAFMTAPIK
jgi:hypothetical protein